MILCNIFTSTKTYRDVLEMIYTLDNQISKSIIIGKDSPALPKTLNNTVTISPERCLKGLRYWWWAARRIEEIAKMGSASQEEWIVLEHVVGLSCAILRLKRQTDMYRASFLVFPTLKFLFKQGWKADKWAWPLKKEQEKAYLLEFMKRSAIELITLWAVDVILANSPEIIWWNKRITRKPKYFLFPNSVEPIVNLQRNHIVKKSQEFNILFVANMQPHKGVATAMEIFARFIEEGGRGCLKLIGPIYPYDKEWFMGLLAKYSERCLSKYIQYLGYVPFDDLWRYYIEASVMLFPTYFEGSPRVVQEALLYGTPVIVSDLPGTRFIDPSEKSIMFFRPGDIDNALRFLWRCYEDRQWRAERGDEGIRLMRENFSAARVGGELLRICKDILNY